MERTLRRGRRRRGFTLIEVLLVLAILVIMASVVVVAVVPMQNRAKARTARTQISQFETLLKAYWLDVGDYPATAQGLDALRYQPSDLPNPAKWSGPYLDKDVPPDPWGRAYQYQWPSSHNPDLPDIWSLGADGQDGTADDVCNWQQE